MASRTPLIALAQPCSEVEPVAPAVSSERILNITLRAIIDRSITTISTPTRTNPEPLRTV